MTTLPAARVEAIGSAILEALGTPAQSATLVSRDLIRSHLMGVESHGVIRVLEYADGIRSGRILPGAPSAVIEETETTAIVDCGNDLGIVSAGLRPEVRTGVRPRSS